MPRAEIATKQAKFTLEKLHAELGGKILDNKAEAKRLTTAMLHVEAVLKMLVPGYDVRSIAVRRRKPNPYFKRGTVWRTALDVLRKADGPMTAREITVGMFATKGVHDPSTSDRRTVEGAVQSALNSHKDNGIVCEGSPARWQIAGAR